MKQYIADARRQYRPRDGIISVTSSRLDECVMDGSLKNQQKECDIFLSITFFIGTSYIADRCRQDLGVGFIG